MLVLQVIVQAKTLAGEVFTDDRHRQVRSVLAAVFLRQAKPQMARLVSEAPRLAQQFFPFLAWQAAIVEIGARPFAAVIEEADIVILLLKRLDLVLDKLVEHDQVIGNVLWNVEVHDVSLPGARLCSFKHSNLRWDGSNLCRRGNLGNASLP